MEQVLEMCNGACEFEVEGLIDGEGVREGLDDIGLVRGRAVYVTLSEGCGRLDEDREGVDAWLEAGSLGELG